MSDETPTFSPRSRQRRASSRDVQNLRVELERIRERTRFVEHADRSGFKDGALAYDVASMAVIRLATVLERPEAAPMVARMSGDELTALRATRNIASHAGYPAMNDDLFWNAVTHRIPALIERLLEALDDGGAAR